MRKNLTDAGEPIRLNVGLVSANTFDVLGTRPLLGRRIMLNAPSAPAHPAHLAHLA